MSILNKIKSVFIVQDPEQSSTESNVQEIVKVDETGSDKSYKLENSQKSYELLSGILEKNNFPGYDYFEFKKALQSVSKLATLDEPNVYKTVYAAAQAMNVDSKLLIKTANDYLNLLENEQTKFHQAADNFLSQQTQQKTSELQSLESSIAQNKQKLEQLKQEIAEDESKLDVLNKDLSVLKTKVLGNKNEFELNYKAFAEEIRQDIQKMERYLS